MDYCQKDVATLTQLYLKMKGDLGFDADEINYLDIHQSFADRLLLNDLECQSIFEVSEKRVTFELLNTQLLIAM